MIFIGEPKEPNGEPREGSCSGTLDLENLTGGKAVRAAYHLGSLGSTPKFYYF